MIAPVAPSFDDQVDLGIITLPFGCWLEPVRTAGELIFDIDAILDQLRADLRKPAPPIGSGEKRPLLPLRAGEMHGLGLTRPFYEKLHRVAVPWLCRKGFASVASTFAFVEDLRFGVIEDPGANVARAFAWRRFPGEPAHVLEVHAL